MPAFVARTTDRPVEIAARRENATIWSYSKLRSYQASLLHTRVEVDFPRAHGLRERVVVGVCRSTRRRRSGTSARRARRARGPPRARGARGPARSRRRTRPPSGRRRCAPRRTGTRRPGTRCTFPPTPPALAVGSPEQHRVLAPDLVPAQPVVLDPARKEVPGGRIPLTIRDRIQSLSTFSSRGSSRARSGRAPTAARARRARRRRRGPARPSGTGTSSRPRRRDRGARRPTRRGPST